MHDPVTEEVCPGDRSSGAVMGGDPGEGYHDQNDEDC